MQTLAELGSVFAKDCGGEYVESYEDIFSYIESAPSNVIVVIFTAGDLDWHMRGYI